MRTSSLAAGIVVCLLGGCGACGNVAGSLAKKGVEKATGVSVESDGGQVTIKTDKGSASLGTSTTLPDDFPLPKVDGAKVAYVTHVDSPEGKARQVSLELPRGDAVNGWEKALQAGGAKVTRAETTAENGRTVTLIWEQGTKGGSATVTSGQDGKATALVMWGDKPAAAPAAKPSDDDSDGDDVEENE